MTTQSGRLPGTLTQWLEKWIVTQGLSAGSGSSWRLTPLAGDGSNRTFYRLDVTWDLPSNSSGAPPQTFIVLFDPSWTLSKDYPPHQVFLAGHGIPVPAFHGWDPSVGCLVMDDLGDELLQARILAEPSKKTEWLRRATVLLAQLHGRTFPVPADLPVHARRFDREKYRDELLFTSEHLREKLLGLPAYTGSQRKTLEDFCARLASIGVDVFSHRDYHTRNLLVKGDALWMIDFQDARMGPIHYDLASLLYDAYVPATPDERRELLALYRQEIARYPLAKSLRWENFDDELARVAFQRVVKAAGSFASFYTRYQKKTHLPYLLPALRSAAELQARSAALREVESVFPIADWIDRSEAWYDRAK